jgi:hypothetical protein
MNVPAHQAFVQSNGPSQQIVDNNIRKTIAHEVGHGIHVKHRGTINGTLPRPPCRAARTVAPTWASMIALCRPGSLELTCCQAMIWPGTITQIATRCVFIRAQVIV